MKKITKITIKHLPDYEADLDYIGTYSDEKDEFGIEIENPRAGQYRYFNPQKGAVENMEQAQKNYETMQKYDKGELYQIGIKAEAEIETSDNGNNWLINHITSGGLWGIEQGYENDKEDIKAIEDEQAEELKETLKKIGFTDEDFAGVPVHYSDE